MNVAVLTDSTSDITSDLAKQLGVAVVPLYINFKNAVKKDRLEITTTDVIEGVRAGAAMPSTSQPTPVDFQEAYKTLLQTHDHVLSIHLSSGLSGTFQSAVLAAHGFADKITTIDTGMASGSLAMMVERATRLLKAGQTPQQVKSTLEMVRAKSTVRFSVATMDYLKKNGRIGGAQALLGGLLNIKPILQLVNGKVEAAGRARGAQKALEEMVNAMKAHLAQHGPSRAVYIYTEKAEDVQALRDQGNALGIAEYFTVQTGPVISAHVGPGTYAVFLEPIEV